MPETPDAYFDVEAIVGNRVRRRAFLRGCCAGIAGTIAAKFGRDGLMHTFGSDRSALMEEAKQLQGESFQLICDIETHMKFRAKARTAETKTALDESFAKLLDRIRAFNDRVREYNARLLQKRLPDELYDHDVIASPRSLGFIDIDTVERQFRKPIVVGKDGKIEDLEFKTIAPDPKNSKVIIEE